MAFYSRFGSTATMMIAPESPLRLRSSFTPALYTVSPPPPAPIPVPEPAPPPPPPVPTKTKQELAEEELERIQQAALEAETDYLVQEQLDPGAPPPTPWMLYAGIGAGALVLIGGVLLMTRKKSSVAGYRKRRSRRSRR